MAALQGLTQQAAGRFGEKRATFQWGQRWYHSLVPSREELARRIAASPANVRFADLNRLCTAYFGKPRNTGGSHMVYKTPWPGDPRVNIQNSKGNAKPYQVRQVLAAIEKLERGDEK